MAVLQRKQTDVNRYLQEEEADRESQMHCHLQVEDFKQSLTIQLAAMHDRNPLSIIFHLSGKSP